MVNSWEQGPVLRGLVFSFIETVENVLSKTTVSKLGRDPSPELPSLQSVKNKFLCSIRYVCDILLWQPKLTKPSEKNKTILRAHFNWSQPSGAHYKLSTVSLAKGLTIPKGDVFSSLCESLYTALSLYTDCARYRCMYVCASFVLPPAESLCWSSPSHAFGLHFLAGSCLES